MIRITERLQRTLSPYQLQVWAVSACVKISAQAWSEFCDSILSHACRRLSLQGPITLWSDVPVAAIPGWPQTSQSPDSNAWLSRTVPTKVYVPPASKKPPEAFILMWNLSNCVCGRGRRSVLAARFLLSWPSISVQSYSWRVQSEDPKISFFCSFLEHNVINVFKCEVMLIVTTDLWQWNFTVPPSFYT